MELGPLSPSSALAETCRVAGSRVPLWVYHRERLCEGGCSSALLEEAERALAEAVSGVGLDGVAPQRTARLRAHLEIGTDGAVSVELERRLSSLDIVNGPVLVPVLMSELPPAPVLPSRAAKPADRSWWDAAARIARSRSGHQALIVSANGFVADGSSATVWVVIDGMLVTPPVSPAIAGVARRFVLSRAAAVGIEAAVRPIRAGEVDSADEVLLTNAFGGAVAVRGRGGPVTARVRDLFADVWRPPAAR